MEDKRPPFIISEPIVVFPVVYELPINHWRWCKLQDICDCAVNIMQNMKFDWRPSPAELVRNFAVLARGEQNVLNDGKRLFRYSPDGKDLRAKVVPCNNDIGTDPPYADFAIPELHPDMFVPEGWARDALRAIRQGCECVIQGSDQKIIGQLVESESWIFLKR